MHITIEKWEQVEKLADAMCQVLNELASGNTVNDLVKARATIAMQPFLMDDNGDLPDIEWAKATIEADEMERGFTEANNEAHLARLP